MNPEDIRAARKARGLSQSALAAKVGVHQVRISNWESGKSVPSVEQSAALRAELGPSALDDASAISGGYGDWISDQRIRQGLSRADLAARAGISVPGIHNIETGRTANPRESTRRKLERALGQAAPQEIVEAAEEQAEIQGVGQFVDFDPHDENDYPPEPGVYVFYDVSDRPVYVGESGDIRRRIRTGHVDKFWFRSPIVEKASYVRVDDQQLRRQLENALIKFLKSNAVINQKQVER